MMILQYVIHYQMSLLFYFILQYVIHYQMSLLFYFILQYVIHYQMSLLFYFILKYIIHYQISLLIYFILRYIIRYQMSLLLDMRCGISSSLVVRIMSQRAFVDESLTSQVYCMSLAVSRHKPSQVHDCYITQPTLASGPDM